MDRTVMPCGTVVTTITAVKSKPGRPLPVGLSIGTAPQTVGLHSTGRNMELSVCPTAADVRTASGGEKPDQRESFQTTSYRSKISVVAGTSVIRVIATSGSRLESFITENRQKLIQMSGSLLIHDEPLFPFLCTDYSCKFFIGINAHLTTEVNVFIFR